MQVGWQHLWSFTDNVFYFIMVVSLILLFGITATMIFFVVRYGRKRNPVASEIVGSTALEIIWTAIPTILVLAIFWAGWKGFVFLRTVPKDAMPVKVSARMWSWSFEYPNGMKSQTLNVPVGKPVKLIITSEDVLHSLYIPAFRVKEDAVPGRETYLWFKPEQAGSYDIFCSEYCGLSHAEMITKAVSMPTDEFNRWYEGKGESGGAQVSRGEKLTSEKGCVGCHSTDGTQSIGPSLKGMFGKKEIVIEGGRESEVTVDEKFIHQKLFESEKYRIKGYPPVMPSQKGTLSDKEADDIIDYVKSLK